MRFKTLSVFILLILFTLTAQADKNNQGFKVIGYYSLRSAMNGFHRFPFKMVTHVNLFFLNPDTTGNFTSDFSALGPFVRKAHRKHVKVLFSIAGGSEHPYYHRLMQDGNRSLMVRGLVEQVLKYDLDGIDVDIEGNDIDNNYEAFVVELADSLKSRGKIITSAIAVYSKDKLSDRALAQYDFVNIMVYDRTGPWRPDKPGPHSTYENAVEDLEYFGTERNLPADKMVLGVPFYGYGFGPESTSPAKTMNYDQIISEFKGSESADEWNMGGGYTMYYNGIPTIRKKTELAKEKASGIMIWQLGGDTHGSKSLLKVINSAAYNGH